MNKLSHIFLLFLVLSFSIGRSGCPMGSIYITHGTISMYSLYSNTLKFPVIDNMPNFKVILRAACLEKISNVLITCNDDTVYKSKTGDAFSYYEIQLKQKVGSYKIESCHSRFPGRWIASFMLTGYDPLIIPPDTLGNAAILKKLAMTVPVLEEPSSEIIYSSMPDALRITCAGETIEELVVYDFDGRLISQAKPRQHSHEIPFTEMMPSAVIVSVKISSGKIERKKFFLSR